MSAWMSQEVQGEEGFDSGLVLQEDGRWTRQRQHDQHADYLIKQLLVFQRTDERPEASLMKTVAHELTPQNIRDAAGYLQAMPGL
jgi:hypothetical protein